jgi:small multidrug resistance pump
LNIIKHDEFNIKSSKIIGVFLQKSVYDYERNFFDAEEKLMNYLLLLVSIGFEVLGTSLLKKTNGFTNLLPTLGTLLSYFICLFVLSHVLKRLPLSLTYATWGSVGLILVTIAGIVFYQETLSIYSIIGLFLVVTGTVLINVF